MYLVPTAQQQYEITSDDSPGWTIFALQRAINKIAYATLDDGSYIPGAPRPVVEDFAWGPATASAVKQLKILFGFDVVTEVANSKLQRHIVKFFTGDHPVSPPAYKRMYAQLPDNLLHGLSYGEASYCLACVSDNITNGVRWSADLGAFQNNLTTTQMTDESLVKRSFDVRYMTSNTAVKIMNQFETFLNQPGCAGNAERAWRCAAYYHNRPSDSSYLASHPNWDTDLPDSWYEDWSWLMGLPYEIKLPDGTRMRSRWDWARFYAIGWGAHNWNGLVCQYVKSWAPQGA